MNLAEIAADQTISDSQWLLWKKETFCLVSHKPVAVQQNRETLARVYDACVKACPEEFECIENHPSIRRSL